MVADKFNEMEGGCSNDRGGSLAQVLRDPIRKDYNVFQNFILLFVYYGQRIWLCLENMTWRGELEVKVLVLLCFSS